MLRVFTVQIIHLWYFVLRPFSATSYQTSGTVNWYFLAKFLKIKCPFKGLCWNFLAEILEKYVFKDFLFIKKQAIHQAKTFISNLWIWKPGPYLISKSILYNISWYLIILLKWFWINFKGIWVPAFKKSFRGSLGLIDWKWDTRTSRTRVTRRRICQKRKCNRR